MKPVAPRPRCLIVEDQALISFSLEAYFTEMDISVCGPFLSRREALGWLATETPQIAVIDYWLEDGPSDELARALAQRGVPIIIYSGRPRPRDLPPFLDAALWLEKPTNRTVLLAAVQNLLAATPLAIA